MADEELRVWDGQFLAVWPDGSTSDVSLNGHPLGVGEALPGHEDAVLERYDTTTGPLIDGKRLVVGHFRLR